MSTWPEGPGQEQRMSQQADLPGDQASGSGMASPLSVSSILQQQGFREGEERDVLVLSLTVAARSEETEEQGRGRRSKPTPLTELISRVHSV